MSSPYAGWGKPPPKYKNQQQQPQQQQQQYPPQQSSPGFGFGQTPPLQHHPQSAGAYATHPPQQYGAYAGYQPQNTPQSYGSPNQWQQQEAQVGFIPNMLDYTAFVTINQRYGAQQQQQQQQPTNLAASYPPVQPPAPSWNFPRVGRSEPISDFYTCGKELGKGAFSTVYLGTNKSTNEEYAIKVIKKNAADQNAMSMVVTEIKVFQSLGNHEHIVGLEDVFETNNNFYLVLQKITGGEVFERILELKHFSEQQASKLVREMLQGIDNMWEKNIAHRDLKPENLLLSSKDNNAKLLITDFGLSQILNLPTELMSIPVGTPAYLAPEVIRCIDCGAPYGRECDMWSVGVIIYVMLCGFAPFYGNDNNEMFQKIKAGYYGFPSPYWDNISDSAKDLIQRCLQLNPQQRITPSQALQHPWITEWKKLHDTHLAAAVQNLETFTKKKFRGAIQKVMAMNRFKKATGLLGKGSGEGSSTTDTTSTTTTTTTT